MQSKKIWNSQLIRKKACDFLNNKKHWDQVFLNLWLLLLSKIIGLGSGLSKTLFMNTNLVIFRQFNPLAWKA